MFTLIPLHIKSVMGHSGPDRRMPLYGCSEWVVTPKHTVHVYHYGKSENLDSILRCGLLPGGPVKEQRRCHLYFSFKNPIEGDTACSGRPVHYRLTNPILKITPVTWPIDEDYNVIYVVEVQRCNELGIQLRQNQTGAVLCSSGVPPECISKVIDFKNNLFFSNDVLNTTAPGDRKANLDVGAEIKRARFYLQLKDGMTTWPNPILETDLARQEKKLYNSYDRNINDEQMCAHCKQFCFKGIKFCTKCLKALHNRDNPNQWTELGMAQRVDFANAELSKLIWKPNKQYRSLFKKYGEEALKEKGAQLFKRATKGYYVTDASTGKTTLKKFAGCEDRWNLDATFRARMINANGYDKNQMRLFDQWAAAPKQPPKKMEWKDRKAKFGEYGWRLTQTQAGGSDTIPTELYPKFQKDNAVAERAKQEVKLQESVEYQQEQASSSWQTPSYSQAEQSTPVPRASYSSGVTWAGAIYPQGWNWNTWQQQDWQAERTARSKWPASPWAKQENQWKRQKW